MQQSARVLLDLGLVEPGRTYDLPVQVLGDDDLPMAAFIQPEPPLVKIVPKLPAAEMERRVQIVPTWEGAPASDYRLDRYDVMPASIRLVGPPGMLAGIASIDTLPIPITGLRTNRSFNAELDLPEGTRVADDIDIVVNVRVRRG